MAPLIPSLPNRSSGTEPLQQYQPQFSTLAANGDAQAVLSTLLAQHQHQQQVHATQSMAASSQSQSLATEALLATLLQAQLQQQPQPNKPQPQPSQQEIAMAMLSAEIQRVQAQEQANTFMASLFQNSLTTPASSPPQQHAMSHFVQYQQSPTPSNHIQTAGAPSSETEGSAALASALMTSLLQSSHMAHGHHSFS
jgi:exopolyphosphatase/pppGpp-phosphohydrolase